MVERLMVVSNPLASNPEDVRGPGLLQQSSEFLRSYGITPESSFVGTAVGALVGGSLFRGAAIGFLAGSLVSMGLNCVRKA